MDPDPNLDPDPKFPKKSDLDPKKIISDPQHCDSLYFLLTYIAIHLLFREMWQHFGDSGHTEVIGVICECGKKFKGGPTATYLYHR